MMIRNDLIKLYVTPLSPQPTGLSPAGHLAGSIECILFDIYGTLFISGVGDISVARQASPQISKLEKLIARYELNVAPRILIEKLHAAIEARHHQLKQSGIDMPEVEIDLIWQNILACHDIEQARKFAIEYELIANPVYPMPNLAKLLRACRQRNHHVIRKGTAAEYCFRSRYIDQCSGPVQPFYIYRHAGFFQGARNRGYGLA